MLERIGHEFSAVGRFWRSVAVSLWYSHAFNAAAAMSFHFFFSLVPLLILLGALLGEAVSAQGAEALAGPLLRVIPGSAAELIRQQMHALSGTKLFSIGPLVVLGFLVSTSSGVHALMDIFELIAQAHARTWIRQRLIALVFVLVGTAAILLLAWLVYRVGLGSMVDPERIHGPLARPLLALRALFTRGWSRVGALLLCTGFFSVLLAAFYRFGIAHPEHEEPPVWPGTATALVAWVLVSWAFAEYVGALANYAVYYGSLAAVAILLLWLYLTSLAFVLGFIVNSEVARLRTERAEDSNGQAHEGEELSNQSV